MEQFDSLPSQPYNVVKPLVTVMVRKIVSDRAGGGNKGLVCSPHPPSMPVSSSLVNITLCSPNEDVGRSITRLDVHFLHYFSMIRRQKRVLTPLKSTTKTHVQSCDRSSKIFVWGAYTCSLVANQASGSAHIDGRTIPSLRQASSWLCDSPNRCFNTHDGQYHSTFT